MGELCADSGHAPVSGPCHKRIPKVTDTLEKVTNHISRYEIRYIQHHAFLALAHARAHHCPKEQHAHPQLLLLRHQGQHAHDHCF